MTVLDSPPIEQKFNTISNTSDLQYIIKKRKRQIYEEKKMIFDATLVRNNLEIGCPGGT